jgi:hypothetical protein
MTLEPDMPQFDVFLSHTSVDKPWVIQLKDDLFRYGVSVWLDKDEIRPGDLFAKALEEGLANSRAMALIVSPEAMASGWVEAEYYRALSLAQNKQSPLQLIPVILRDAKLPGFLKDRTWVDFRDRDAYAQNVWMLVWGISGKKPTQVIDLTSPGLASTASFESTEQTETRTANITASGSIPGESQRAPGIPPDLNNRIQVALLDCGPFSSDDAIRAVFVDNRLSPWRNSLPQANNPNSRVQAIVEFLYDRFSQAGENAVVSLLRVLSERTDPGDACHQRLADLADKLEHELRSPIAAETMALAGDAERSQPTSVRRATNRRTESSQILVKLRDLLIFLYPTAEDSRRVVEDAGLDPAYISFSAKGVTNWHNILKEAQKRNKLQAIIEVARNDYPENDRLIRISEAIENNLEPSSSGSSAVGRNFWRQKRLLAIGAGVIVFALVVFTVSRVTSLDIFSVGSSPYGLITKASTETPLPGPGDLLKPTGTPTTILTATGTPADTPTLTAAASSIPTDIPTATSTSTNTPTSTATSAPTDTPTPRPTATGTHTNTPTSTATSTPTDTPRPIATATGTSTNTPRPTAMTTIPMPVLKSPDDGTSAATGGTTIFEWQWNGELQEGWGFDILIWKEGIDPDHFGGFDVLDIRNNLQSSGNTYTFSWDVASSYSVQQHGGGEYTWTVLVVQVTPYERIGPEATPRTLNVTVGGGGPGPGPGPTKPPPPEP